jgi:IS5 family transposase
MLKNTVVNEISFADIAFSDAEERWSSHWMKMIGERVNWKPFEKRFRKLYSLDEGRPAWDPIVLFRCLLLAEWNTLSDRQLEESIAFRFDFRRFAGIPLGNKVPDATTFVVFRGRIQHLWDRLLGELNEQIECAGYRIHKAIAADATLVEAHSKPKKRKKKANTDDHKPTGGDPDASWRGFPAKKAVNDHGEEVIARRPALYGYKINLAASVNTGFVGMVSVCPANEHETHHLEELMSEDTDEVYADKGYVGKRGYLKSRRIKDGIQAKATRGHPLRQRDIQRNKRITHKRRIVEGVFGSWKQWYGWYKTRFMGLAKNQYAVSMTAIAWNMKKWAKYEMA